MFNGQTKRLLTMQSRKSSIMSLEEYGSPVEFEIPLPYGNLAAKAWGPKDGKPLLGLHGYYDNANSFDLLCQYLPDTVYFITYDQIGHGKSCRLPQGILYSTAQFLVEIRYVLEYLGWKKYSIIGHSVGSQLGLAIASAYPEEVEFIVTLDCLYPWFAHREHDLRKGMDWLMDTITAQEKGEAQIITESEAMQIHMTKLRAGVPREGAVALLKRGSYRVADGRIALTVDERIGCHFNSDLDTVSPDLLNKLPRTVKAKMLIITGSLSFLTKVYPEKQQQARTALKHSCERFKEITVPTFHYPHMEDPEAVSEAITKFMNL